jgi:hypothetical protein
MVQAPLPAIFATVPDTVQTVAVVEAKLTGGAGAAVPPAYPDSLKMVAIAFQFRSTLSIAPLRRPGASLAELS